MIKLQLHFFTLPGLSMLLGQGHNDCAFPLCFLAFRNKILLEILMVPRLLDHFQLNREQNMFLMQFMNSKRSLPCHKKVNFCARWERHKNCRITGVISKHKEILEVRFGEGKRWPNRTCLNTQILGNALSFAYAMMVPVTDLRLRSSIFHLLPRCYISCWQDLSSASHSFTKLTYLLLQFFLSLCFPTPQLLLH